MNLRFNLDAAIREKIARGMAPEAARRETLMDFGGREQCKQECWDAHRIASVENTFANLNSAARFLRKSAGFSVTVVLTLALGIGANTAVFCAVDAVLLRALPYPHSNELVEIHQFNRHSSNPTGLLAPARLKDWSAMNTSLQAISGYYTENVSETSGALPEKRTSANVAPGFFDVMGIVPELGRSFVQGEYHFGGPDAVVVSDRFWRERFHADPAVLGKRLHIEGRSFPIVGVMPRSFHFPNDNVDLWQAVPLDAPFEQNRRFTWFTGIGRRKPGVTVDEARANLNLVQARLARQFPATDKDLTASVERLKQVTVGTSGHSLWLLYGSVSLLLLIACANVAALLLSRIADRQREIAIRYSLGASRRAIVAQLLTETLLLGFLGSCAGLGVAAVGLRIFHSLIQALPRAPEIGIESQILLYTLISAFGATLLCGIIPALLASRRTISSTLAVGSRTQASGNTRLQWSLVGMEVALAVTLLIGAGLLIRSFQRLKRVSLGFDASHVLTFQVSGNYGETGSKGLSRAHDADA